MLILIKLSKNNILGLIIEVFSIFLKNVTIAGFLVTFVQKVLNVRIREILEPLSFLASMN